MHRRVPLGLRRVVLGSALTIALGAAMLVGVTTTDVLARAYHGLVYAVVAQRVTAGSSSPQDEALRLADFIFMNVRTPDDAAAIDDTPADTLLRGYGYCDPAVMAYLRLLQEVGISGRLTFLRQDDGTSPHSVAEVWLDGGWRVFDVYYGFTPRLADGEIATREDLLAQPALLDDSRAEPAWYRNAVVVATSDAGTMDLDSALARAFVHLAPDWLLARAQDAYLLLPPPTYEGAGYYTDGTKPMEVPDYSSPDGRQFWAARNYQVFGRVAEAQTRYQALVARSPEGAFADDALYQLALLNLTLEQQPAQALASLDTLDADYPHSAWGREATYLEARAYEETGACTDAAARYEEVIDREMNGAEDARHRLDELPCVDLRRKVA